MDLIESKIEQVFLPELKDSGVSLYVKREDLIHPLISGNKYRKLFYNIEYAKKHNFKKLLTFGGAYSNHILATAGAGFLFGFKTIGVIRGEELGLDLEKTLSENPTLKKAYGLGMEFCFISRNEYKLKYSKDFSQYIDENYPNSYVLPEGGTNDLAIRGCEDILGSNGISFDVICAAVGTGGTLSGIINSSLENQLVLGFPALKGAFLTDQIKSNKINKYNWKLISDYHFGGYAKINKELITFSNKFYQKTGILLDPVYTNKMFYGIVDMIKNKKFPSGTRVLAIHTGGLQGIKGMNTILAKKELPLLMDNRDE